MKRKNSHLHALLRSRSLGTLDGFEVASDGKAGISPRSGR